MNARPEPVPNGTGDRGVDEILQDLERELASDPERQVDAVAEAHRRLQARLSDPGQSDTDRSG